MNEESFSDPVDRATDIRLRAAFRHAPLPVPPALLEMLEKTRLEALREATEAQRKVVVFPITADAVPASRRAPASAASTASPMSNGRKAARRPWLGPLAAMVACAAFITVALSLWRREDGRATGGPAMPVALAPQGVTGSTRPPLVWEAPPGQASDVWILSPEKSQTEARVLFVAKNVKPPLEFAALRPGPGLPADASPSSLEPGARYRLLVCTAGAGKLAGTAVPFEVAPEARPDALPSPASPGAALTEAQRLRGAGRSGDALLLLERLSEPWRRDSPGIQGMLSELRAELRH